MKTGALRKRLQFQAQSGTPNAVGETSGSWSTYYTAWGELDVLRSAMMYQTADFISESTYRIVIRFPWGQNISPGDRILWTGSDSPPISQLFVIDAVVNPEFRNRELQILAHVVNEND